ncbi:MAG: LysR substrate-binding domain-containing protein [Myxococcota bacterium]
MQETRGVTAFVAVAEQRSFSGAARTLGVTASALSQSVRALEERVGVPLFARSTRSVNLTEAGQRLFERLRPALRETEAALEEARASLDVAQGTLRLTAGRLTVPLVIEPVLPALLREHPKLSVELSIDDRFVDIVELGFDAGVRLNEAIQPDFTVVRLTPPFRLLVAGAPSYFAKRPRPHSPSELVAHECINYRMGSTGAFYAWEFERRGREFSVAVNGRFSCNDGLTMLNAAVSGLGLVYIHEQAIRPLVQRGELEVVLADYAVSVPGFFLYFPRRAGVQPKLRAFIDVARRVLKPSTAPATSSEPKRLPRRRRA